ncbi:hypothetical protein BJX63DRAFT_1658 [Aspergillus granulosus]|uniref:Secreted protein n=1 Tax=Aspergillus granulosus TaxID=176169 RepID=A0ABR4I5A1_9EURO
MQVGMRSVRCSGGHLACCRMVSSCCLLFACRRLRIHLRGLFQLALIPIEIPKIANCSVGRSSPGTFAQPISTH